MLIELYDSQSPTVKFEAAATMLSLSESHDTVKACTNVGGGGGKCTRVALSVPKKTEFSINSISIFYRGFGTESEALICIIVT